jgi:predicted negative regulator of RcsB-dependent stress response
MLLIARGKEDEAVNLLRDALAMADKSGANDIAEKAAHDLGAHLSQKNDFAEAESLLRRARASDDEGVALVAAFSLGVLLRRTGRPKEAEQELHYAARHPQLAQLAQRQLEAL